MGDRVGQHLGNYRLIRLLGQGGFAEVYLGEHLYLKTHAAIKVLRVHLGKEHEQDFLREAQTLAHLEHSHIVRILEFGVHEETPFLVMQYAVGGSIRMLHPRGTILQTTTVLSYLKETASALQYAHDQKIIHRDIKPENLLLDQKHHLLLSDFGLALVASSLPDQQKVVGTPSYMAPEQLQGHPCIASDQYALGVVVYEWLCGVLPFSGTPLEVATQHIMAVPPLLSQHNPAISPFVEQLVLRALAKDPTRRFIHVAAFITALEQAIASEADCQESPSVSVVDYGACYRHQSFVGRTQERAFLRDLLREAEQQRDSLARDDLPLARISSFLPMRTPSAFLLGDAGIGKTRLAEEIGQEALRCGWAILQTHSYAQESHIPYQAWIEALRHILRQKLWQPQEEYLSPSLCQTLATLIPECSDQLSQEGSIASGALGSEPLRIKEAIFAVLTAISKRMPLLILLDDLHWADVSSIELFGYLVRRLVDFPILLLGTGRVNELPSDHVLSILLSQLQRERFITQISLSRLTDEQIGKLISHLPEPLVVAIQQQADGNPFFAEELARTYSAQKKGIEKTLVSFSSQQSLALPQTVAAVLDQYLRNLSKPCQHLLGCAAVLGGSFSFSTLSLMYARNNIVGSEEETLSSLEEALGAKILLEEGLGNNITYCFRHPLLMSRLYETMSVTRRAMLHRQAAELLRILYTTREEEGAALIVQHLVYGGADPLVIADVAERAGNYAYALAAYPEAERYYRLAIEQQKGNFAETQEIQRDHIASKEEHHHRISLLEQLGECLRIQGNYEDARYYYEQALETRSQNLSIQEMQQERELLAILCIKIGQIWSDMSNLEQAQQCFEQGEWILQDAGIIAGTAMAYLRYQQAFTCWKQGFYEPAYHLAQEARILFEQAIEHLSADRTSTAHMTQIQHTLIGNPLDIGRTHTLLACIHTGLGLHNISIAHLNHALTIFEHYHCHHEIAITCCNLGDFYLRKADYTQAQSTLYRSLKFAEHMSDVPLTVFVLCNLGILQIRTGKLVPAETVLRQGILLAGSLNDPYIASMLYTYLTSALREQGKIDEAINMLRIALQFGRLERTATSIGIILVALGQLRIDQAIEISDVCDSLRTRLLRRASNTLQRGLAMQGLEAETKVEGHLALAHVMFLEGDTEAAYQQALQILEAAQQLELMWLVPHTQCLLGRSSAALGRDEQADQYFEQAQDGFRTYGIRLAYGRTLQLYGQFLRQQSILGTKADQQGQAYLHEAGEIFRECNATRDLQKLKQLLGDASDSSTQKIVVECHSDLSPVL